MLSKCAENQAIRFWELVGSFFCALVVIGSPQAFAKSSQSVENLLDAEFKVEALENWLLVEQEIDESELASLYLETENAEEYLGMLTDLVTEYMESAELSHYEIDADSYDLLIVELLLAQAQSGGSDFDPSLQLDLTDGCGGRGGESICKDRDFKLDFYIFEYSSTKTICKYDCKNLQSQIAVILAVMLRIKKMITALRTITMINK